MFEEHDDAFVYTLQFFLRNDMSFLRLRKEHFVEEKAIL